jgi:hypothetical protein
MTPTKASATNKDELAIKKKTFATASPVTNLVRMVKFSFHEQQQHQGMSRLKRI